MPKTYNLRIRCQHPDLDDGGSTSSTSSRSEPSPKKSKSQNWRDKLRATNPTKYRELKKLNKDYSTLYRLQCSTAALARQKRVLSTPEKKEAEVWSKRHQRNNEMARKRMQKMKERKKATAFADKKNGRTLTRNEVNRQREKERIKKQKQRAKMSKEQVEAERQKNRERYTEKRRATLLAAEKALLEERERQLRELAEELRGREAELQAMGDDLEERNTALAEGGIDIRSESTKRKSLERARRAMPKKRSHFVTTAVDLISKTTPKKSAALATAGICPSRDVLSDGVMGVVAELLSAPKPSKARKSLSESMSTLKKKQLVRAASRKFGISRKLLAKAKKDQVGRRPSLPSTVHLIKNFFEANSAQLPDKKYVSKKSGKPRHLIETTIAKLHAEYNTAHPEAQVGASTFYRHRPSHVKPKQQSKYVGCLCEYCENINLKTLAINQLQPGCIKDGYHLVQATMCPKRDDAVYHHPSCIARTCSDCGVGMLDTKLEPLLAEPDREVQWKCWEMVTMKCNSGKTVKEIKKRGLVSKSGTVSELVKALKDDTHPFAEHLFCKDWQHGQERVLRANLSSDEVLGIFDFAENYKCGYQREVQSAYYSHDSATVHPIVLYYLCSDCKKPVTESCIMVSDDLNHDYHLVNAFQRVVSEHLSHARALSINRFFRFSDGCASQYKSKGPISDISYSIDDFGYQIHHNFSGTRHGKGASDGESGVVKRLASDAVKAETAVINCPKALFDYLSVHAAKEAPDGCCCAPFRRSVFYVSFDSVSRDRMHRAVKTVPGTRRLHSIKCLKEGVVMTRNLSCFCGPCLDDAGGCENELYVLPWKEVRLGVTQPADAEASPLPGPNVDEPTRPDSLTTQPGNDVPAPLADNQAAEVNPATQTTDSPKIPNGGDPGARNLAVGEYVGVQFSQKMKGSTMSVVYMALVLEKVTDGAVLKFMRKVQSDAGSYYIFPDKEHPFTHPLSDIICRVCPPTLRNHRSGNQYVFDPEDLREVERCVQGTICMK